jgi:hypothetical protein
MQATLKCPHCGHIDTYNPVDVYLNGAFVLCCECFGDINISTEWVQIENNKNISQAFDEVSPVLEKGESVVIVNEEHPWKDQIALVCDIKHKFVRIELLGKKLWVPNEWVKHYESD